MQQLFIIIFFLLLNLTINNTTYETRSTLLIEGTSYSCTFKDKTIYLGSIKEQDDYQIDILKDKVILKMAISDLDSDNTDELLVISAKEGDIYGDDIIIFRPSIDRGNIAIHEIYRNDFSSVKPWDLQVCDIDGDNIKDIFIGVYKSTPMFSEVENRPFFFNWDGKILSKKWAGSKLEYSFESVAFSNLIGDIADEFIVVEKTEDKEHVSIYYWFGFGFVKFAESKHYDYIDGVRIIELNNKQYLELVVNGNKDTVLLHLEGNKLIENKVTK